MEKYIEQYKIIHNTTFYGKSGIKLKSIIQSVIDFKPESILDYGCGRCMLIDALEGDFIRYRYDPAIDKYSKCIDTADLVICTDVLEHIPIEYLDAVLIHIKSISVKCIFAICTVKACKVLPNGDNAHSTVENINWWCDKIKQYFSTAILVKKFKNKFICKTW